MRCSLLGSINVAGSIRKNRVYGRDPRKAHASRHNGILRRRIEYANVRSHRYGLDRHRAGVCQHIRAHTCCFNTLCLTLVASEPKRLTRSPYAEGSPAVLQAQPPSPGRRNASPATEVAGRPLTGDVGSARLVPHPPTRAYRVVRRITRLLALLLFLPAFAQADDRSTVDVLFLYTPESAERLSWTNSQVRAKMEESVKGANREMEDRNIHIRLNIVDVLETTDYTVDSQESVESFTGDRALQASNKIIYDLQAGRGALAWVEATRRELKADVVYIFIHLRAAKHCGYAFTTWGHVVPANYAYSLFPLVGDNWCNPAGVLWWELGRLLGVEYGKGGLRLADTFNARRRRSERLHSVPEITASLGGEPHDGDIQIAEGQRIEWPVSLSEAPQRPIAIPLRIGLLNGATDGDYEPDASNQDHLGHPQVVFGAEDTSATFGLTLDDDFYIDPGERIEIEFQRDRYYPYAPAGLTLAEESGNVVAIGDTSAVVFPRLLAEFHRTPASHDGSTPFRVRLRFSEELGLGKRAFTRDMLTVTGGTAGLSSQLAPPSTMGWEFPVTPDGDGDVSITLPVNRACGPLIGPCTPNGRVLSAPASVTVAGPSGESPEITSASSFSVLENSTAVATLTATDPDAAELIWLISGGVDRGHFTLGTAGVLAFSSAKDFESPDDADADGVYRVIVEVSDGDGSDTLELAVTLKNRNEAPTADAGADQTGIEPGASVVLSGSGSDPDANDTLTFAWTQTAGPAVALTDADKATAGFTAPAGLSADATLTFSLRVIDEAGLTDEDAVSVAVRGSPPLTAAFSSAPASHDGAALFTVELRFSEEVRASYLWFSESVFEVTGGSVRGARRLTQGSNIGWLITLVPGGDADMVLTLPANRDCSETGAICTADGRTLARSVQLTVPGPAPAEPPEIIGPTGFTVVEGDTTVATLTARDPDTDLADLTWSIPGGAAGGADAGRFTLTGGGALAFADAKDFEVPDDADANGRYQVTVEVSDGAHAATADLTVTLKNRNEAPTADAGADQTGIEPGASVVLSGSGFDPDAGDVLTYAWRQSSGAAVSLIDAQTASAMFTAPSGSTSDATLTFTLTVIDAGGLEDRDAVSVTVRASDEELSDDATLSALSLSGIDIGRFSPTTTSYSARVGNDVSQTTLSATPNHAAAQVRIADSDGSVAGTRRVIALDEGENAIAVTVTAEDGTTRAYTVSVTRAGASDAEAAEGDLRLVNGSGPHEGRVEIFHDERWGTVCDDFWTVEDAAVVCRQLGYDGRAQALRRARFGEGEDPIWMDNVQCEGDEARLAECEFRGWGVHNCKHWEDAGVICGGPPASTSLVGVYLAGDRLTLQYAGRLNTGPAPAPDDFVVLASSNEDLAAVPVRGVQIRGSTVELGLARRVARSEDVSLSYLAAPMNPIEDDSGNPAPSLRGVTVSHLDTLGSRSDVVRVPELAAPGVWETDAPASGIGLLDAAQRGAIKLEQLDLSGQGLTDVTPFWGLSDLERLGLRDNAVSDLTALSGLTDLKCLDLSHNQITDIWPLASLVNLHCLDLSHNGIQDLTALAGLVNLRRLDLSNNRIADLSALVALERLKVVRLDGNAIDDIWAISQLRAPANLGLSRNRIADIGLLTGIGSLQRLDISHNRIADLVVIGSLPGLVWLRLDHNPVANPQTLIGSTHLRQVPVDRRSSRANVWLSTHDVHMPVRPPPGR